MWIFCLEFPQHPRGPLSQHTTKRVGIWVWPNLMETSAWTWVSTTHTDLSLRDTRKPGVPRVHWLRACVCMGLF